MPTIGLMPLFGGFGKAIRHERRRRGIAQAALAKAAGLNIATIRRVEREEIDPSLSTADAILEGLVLNREHLFRLLDEVNLRTPPTPAGEVREPSTLNYESEVMAARDLVHAIRDPEERERHARDMLRMLQERHERRC